MKLPRRQFLHLAAGAAALPAVSRIASAQTYPSRPVRIVVPYPPGGGTDVTARLIAPYLSDGLGQQFIIENRGGAGANIGTDMVAKSPADGYTLLLISTANMINTSLYKNLPSNFMRDITAVAGLVRLPIVLEVHPSFPAKTTAKFIAYAKANPGKVNFASSGTGTSLHLAGELFKAMSGANIVHVPYRGTAPALTDILGGQVQAMFDNLATSLEHIRAGKLRGLGVATSTRSDVIPGLPTLAETVPGYEASSVFGLGAPTGTPAEIIERLNRTVNAALADPGIKARLAELTTIPIPTAPAEFGAEMAATTEKWAKVVLSSGATAEQL
jgi:tripartite-type tricarboxylate transporter receptor subunit TctC